MKIQQNMDVQNFFIRSQFGADSALKSKKNDKKNKSNPLSQFVDKASDETKGVSVQMRHMIRSLKEEQTEKTLNNASSKDKLNGFLQQSGSPEAAKEEEVSTPPKYNYKTVATKIQQAKNSLSAGQAVLAAKRETQKIRRMISAGNGDPEELQIALTHAKRMEMVARKKKHHLELEELVKYTQKLDDELDKQEEAAASMEQAMVLAKEEEVSEKEDEIFDARIEMLDEALENMKESGVALSDDKLTELNEMISEFGEEELEELEESMEMLENMEIVDPHMSKEDLEDLKRKHRASEDKAIMKANMDYLKDMIKYVSTMPSIDIQV